MNFEINNTKELLKKTKRRHLGLFVPSYNPYISKGNSKRCK